MEDTMYNGCAVGKSIHNPHYQKKQKTSTIVAFGFGFKSSVTMWNIFLALESLFSFLIFRTMVFRTVYRIMAHSDLSLPC